MTESSDAPNEPISAERRRTPRVGIDALVHLRGQADWAGSCHTADLSTSGAFLISPSPPPRGTTVELDLELGDELRIEGLHALVVHVRSSTTEPSARGCGVVFLRLGRDQATRLRQVIEARLGDES